MLERIAVGRLISLLLDFGCHAISFDLSETQSRQMRLVRTGRLGEHQRRPALFVPSRISVLPGNLDVAGAIAFSLHGQDFLVYDRNAA